MDDTQPTQPVTDQPVVPVSTPVAPVVTPTPEMPVVETPVEAPVVTPTPVVDTPSETATV